MAVDGQRGVPGRGADCLEHDHVRGDLFGGVRGRRELRRVGDGRGADHCRAGDGAARVAVGPSGTGSHPADGSGRAVPGGLRAGRGCGRTGADVEPGDCFVADPVRGGGVAGAAAAADYAGGVGRGVHDDRAVGDADCDRADERRAGGRVGRGRSGGGRGGAGLRGAADAARRGSVEPVGDADRDCRGVCGGGAAGRLRRAAGAGRGLDRSAGDGRLAGVRFDPGSGLLGVAAGVPGGERGGGSAIEQRGGGDPTGVAAGAAVDRLPRRAADAERWRDRGVVLGTSRDAADDCLSAFDDLTVQLHRRGVAAGGNGDGRDVDRAGAAAQGGGRAADDPASGQRGVC